MKTSINWVMLERYADLATFPTGVNFSAQYAPHIVNAIKDLDKRLKKLEKLFGVK